MRSSAFTRGSALALIAVFGAACADAPTAPEGPGPLFDHAAAANPTPVLELLKVCKVGPAATFTVAYSSVPFFGLAAFALADGECKHIATASSAVTATIVETPGAGSHLVSIGVAYAGTNSTPHVLNVGTATAMVTIGEGTPPSGATVTFTNELDEVGEGCTPGYWKNHLDSWAATGYSPNQQFSSVFENAFPGQTLLSVLNLGGGGLNALGRHAVAALLNAASPGVDYDLTTTQVIDMFNDVFPGGDYETLKNQFEGFNEQGCPLN